MDLGATPLANAYLRPEQLTDVEEYYPLRLVRCERCFLVQVEAVVPPRVLFRDYAYFSSYSDTLLRESKQYALSICERLGLAEGDRVVEIASNDGYLLQYFLERGLNVQGIEPADTVAAAAVRKGIPTLVRFFGTEVARELAAEGRRGHLIVANNVLAHVPDPGDFIDGLKILLEPGGTITIEFHHLLSLIEKGQFDTIYHEHFQYLSLTTAMETLAARGLTVVDVDEIPAQGGSLRLYIRHTEDVAEGRVHAGPKVANLLARELAAGVRTREVYQRLGERIRTMKLQLLSFLVTARQAGQSVVAYGAAAKGNTLLNYCGVHADLIDYVVDRNPHKQGMYLPGSRVPIVHPERVMATRPDYVLVLPWNLSAEIIEQMSDIRNWGGRFVIPVPELTISPLVSEKTVRVAVTPATGAPSRVPVPASDASRRSSDLSVPLRSGT